MFCTSTSGTFENIHLPKNFLDESMKKHRGAPTCRCTGDGIGPEIRRGTFFRDRPTHPPFAELFFIKRKGENENQTKTEDLFRVRGKGAIFGPKSDQRYLHYKGVSLNGGTPQSSILIGFSIINHPFWGTSIFIIFGNTHK